MTAISCHLTAVLVFLGFTLPGPAQNLLPNPGFEDGTERPVGWQLEGGAGEWTTDARSGKRALAVRGTGRDSSYWRSDRLKLAPGGLYRLSFLARQEAGTSGGCAVSGPSRVNRDFHFSEQWQRYSFVFQVAEDGTNDYVRLGQWEVKGRLVFDEVELLPVLVQHTPIAWGSGQQGQLGEAESVEKGVYRFQPQFGWAGANYHRPLVQNRAGFNSDRWVFYPGAEIIYQFTLAGNAIQQWAPLGNPQTNARVRINLNHHVAGSLNVEAGTNGTDWIACARFDGQKRSGTADLPSALFPATHVFLRLSARDANASFQVNACDYEAGLLQRWNTAVKATTEFLEVLNSGPELAIRLFSMDVAQGERTARCSLAVSNTTGRTLTFVASASPPYRRPEAMAQHTLAPGQRRVVWTSALLPAPGTHIIEWTLAEPGGRTLFAGRSEASLGFLYDARPGYLVQSTHDVDVWWCESGWKLGKRLLLPGRATNEPVRPPAVSLARGEYESIQIVVRSPFGNTKLDSVSVRPLRNAAGDEAPIQVRVNDVGYVKVTHPTDAVGQRDDYPDPLPPLKTPTWLFKNENRPLWLTFHAPRETKPGDYRGELQIKAGAGDMRIPLAVHVYDFELPRETHLRSALGLGTHNIDRYHRLTNREQQQLVYEKYLQNFAEHRISPYSFVAHSPIDVRFEGQGADKRAKVDFARFDRAAEKWLDEYKFNSFLLPLRGMGGGTFHSRHLGELEGFQEGTPEFARLFGDYLGQIQQHLQQRGWLDKAYTYWFDEPDPKDYEFVVDGMKRIRAAAPGLRRMLTEQPEKELLGHVEIWCGLTPEWTPEKVRQRRAAGEEVWWYICCAPMAPYVTEFIDHPGTELRLWPWQSWQYGVQGILVWETLYWTSSSAFPGKLQDPWADPMSYVSGYDFGPGHVGYWGNGDGRFLYPPRRDPTTAAEPCLDEPINSIRWENLRDGMEDYEYFWLLDQEVKRLEALTGEAAKRNGSLLVEAKRLLVVPEEISKDLTRFTTDPRLMLAHRDKIARMIERLGQYR